MYVVSITSPTSHKPVSPRMSILQPLVKLKLKSAWVMDRSRVQDCDRCRAWSKIQWLI